MVRRISKFIGVGALTLALAAVATPARADIIQIGSFQGEEGAYAYSNATGVFSGSMTGTFAFQPEFVALFGPPTTTTPYEGATLTLYATATAPALTFFGKAFQPMDGYLEVSYLGTILVRADFTNAILQGSIGAHTIIMQADDPVTSTIVYSSDVFEDAALIPPSAITFTVNPTNVPVGVGANGNLNSFEGVDTANFSSAVDESQIPEPATLSLFGIGAGVVAVAARRRRQSTN
jgi:hypothetical protein